jgi:hypothetical protein
MEISPLKKLCQSLGMAMALELGFVLQLSSHKFPTALITL